MGAVFSFILHAILWLIVLFFIFNLFTNLDLVYKILNYLIIKTKECYEHIRQRICKKSNEVNDDSGAIHDSPEFFDSSSVWED